MTLIQWLIAQIDSKSYRAGKTGGHHHPKVDNKVLEALGGRENLICQARELERDILFGKSGRISFDWCDMNDDIKKIHYSADIMKDLCEREGIEDPRARQLRYIYILKQWQKRAGETWLTDYYENEIRKLEEGNCSKMIQDNLEDGHLYRCLDAILHLEEPLEKPIFSARIFQDVKLQGESVTPSKIFRKKYESKVIGVLRQSPDYMEGMSDDEVLAVHGILSYAQTLEWKGPLRYSLDTGDEVDSSCNKYGTIINSQTLEHAVPRDLAGVKRIMIIENKANYEKKTFREDELFIFCHGFFSPKEVRFLKRVADIAEDGTEYYHWGDMDYGGIRIFQFNKMNVFQELKPYRMGRKDHEKAVAEGAGAKIEENKRKKLEEMDAGELEELKNCILEKKLEIEQELLAE